MDNIKNTIKTISHQEAITNNKKILNNPSLGPQFPKTVVEQEFDHESAHKNFLQEYDQIDVSCCLNTSKETRFEKFQKSVKKKFLFQSKHKKTIQLIEAEIAQTALCCLHFEKKYFTSLMKLVKLIEKLGWFIEESEKEKTGVDYKNSLKHISAFSYEELADLNSEEAAFFLKHLYAVEDDKSIQLKIFTLNKKEIEKLKQYWTHSNPKIALEAKRIYFLTSILKITHGKFPKRVRYQHVTGNIHFKFYFKELQDPCVPSCTYLALKTIIPISTKVFIEFRERSVKFYEKGHSGEDVVFFLNHMRPLLQSYLQAQEKQQDLYLYIYSRLTQIKTNGIKQKIFNIKDDKIDLQNLAQLKCWAQPNTKNDKHEHISLPSSLEAPLIYVQYQPKTPQKEIIKIELPKSGTKPISSQKPKKKPRSKNNPKNNTLPINTNTNTHLTLPKKQPQLPELSLAEKEVQSVYSKIGFMKHSRVRRWEELMESIPETGFPGYTNLTEKQQVEQIERHAFHPIIDRFLHDKRYAIPIEKGFSLLAHVQFSSEKKEYSVIAYGFTEKNQIFHRYIHTFTKIFSKNVLDEIRKTEITDVLIEKEKELDIKESSSSFTLEFKPLSSLFILTDKVRQMIITLFPAPQEVLEKF